MTSGRQLLTAKTWRSVRHWRWSGGPRPPEIMSDHQNIQTQWSDGPPKFSALSKIVKWQKNRSYRRHSQPIIQETLYRSRPFHGTKQVFIIMLGMNYWGRDWPSALVLFTELKICVNNHAGYELLRPRSTINPADVVSKGLTAYKIVGHFFGLSYHINDILENIGSNKVRGRTVIIN